MPQTYLYVDVEGPLRTWVRSLATINALVASPSAFFGFPAGRALPVITMYRIGGGPAGGDHPVEEADVSFTVWAETKAAAAAIAAALVTALRNLASQVVEGVELKSVTNITSLFQPDTSTDPDTPRYIVDATVVCIAV